MVQNYQAMFRKQAHRNPVGMPGPGVPARVAAGGTNGEYWSAFDRLRRCCAARTARRAVPTDNEDHFCLLAFQRPIVSPHNSHAVRNQNTFMKFNLRFLLLLPILVTAVTAAPVI